MSALHRSIPAIVALLITGIPAFGADLPTKAEQLSRPLPPFGISYDRDGREVYDAGWSIDVDNDILTATGRDRDYTGGFAVTLQGRRAAEYRFSIDPLLRRFDRASGFARLYGPSSRYRLHALQLGLVTFTPEDLEAVDPIHDDRPYASLLYVANSRLALHQNNRTAYQSTLTVGLLGTPVAEWLQRGLHVALDSRQPNGYAAQISDGGEPTLRYAVARRQLLRSGYSRSGTAYDLLYTLEGSVGYITEGSIAISARWGRIDSPWWSYSPELRGYAGQPTIGAAQPRRRGLELYAYGGIELHARAYNAFLQGQWRDSVVRYSADELEPLIPEIWLGVALQTDPQTLLSYEVRYQGAEIERGRGARDLLWAGVKLTRSF